MKTVGLAGGSSLCELGPAADVELFFECIHSFAVPKWTVSEANLLTDRLYRRYLRENEVEPASLLMRDLRLIFSRTPTEEVDLGGIEATTAVSRLDPTSANLAELFASYFECFEQCRESSELFLSTWKILQPIRLVLADTLDFIVDKKRPLAQYETLEGRPFWLRHIPSSNA